MYLRVLFFGTVVEPTSGYKGISRDRQTDRQTHSVLPNSWSNLVRIGIEAVNTSVPHYCIRRSAIHTIFLIPIGDENIAAVTNIQTDRQVE